MTILVVDDNELNVYQLEVLLGAEGYQVVTAANGAEALAAARAEAPDLILSDILMPVMDGFALCREWLADETLQRIPFVFYTATYTDERDREFALSLGATAFLVKPAEHALILSTLRAALDAPPSATAASPPAPSDAVADDSGFLRGYNEALIRKLEAKMEQLSEANRVLEQDIAERRKVEAALRESERFARSAIDALSTCLGVVDQAGTILTTNRAWRDLVAVSPSSLVNAGEGDNYLALCDAARGATETTAFAAGLRAVIRGDQHEFTMEYAGHTPAEQRWFVGRAARFAGGGPVRVVVTHRNVTERVRAERERAHLAAQMRQQQKLESIGTLASGVAHEINNPIMGVMYYAQLLRDATPAGSEQVAHADEILHETERIALVVRNLLQFARQDRQVHSPSRMVDIVDGTLSLIRAVLRHDQVVLEVDVPAELPLVDCHSQQIQQVLMNLVTNARDALNERYPGYDDDKRIIVACRAVDHEGRPGVCLTVEDHGLGISEEIAGRILDPFYTTKAGELGTGLGLSISHGIVQEHQGRLWYETRAGHWTKFHVDLPVNHRTE